MKNQKKSFIESAGKKSLQKTATEKSIEKLPLALL